MTREKKPVARSLSNGFTLLESALAVLISSILLFAAISLLKTAKDETNIAENRKRLDVIQQAIINYEALYDKLPCPSSFTAAGTPSFGRSTNCTASVAPGTYSKPGRQGATDAFGGAIKTGTIIFGAVPVRDLGLPDSYAANTYGYMYTYAITRPEATALNGFAGAIDIVDDSNNTILPLASDKMTRGTATYVVVDHGSDGKGAYYNGSTTAPTNCSGGLDQLNCSFETTTPANPFKFRSAPFSEQSGASHFDDMLIYSSGSQAIAKTCQTVYSAPSAAVATGTSKGHYQHGMDYGGGMDFGAVVVYIGFFTDGFYYSDYPSPSGGMNPNSPKVIASCTGGTYIAGGGCTQTKGPPSLDASGTHFTNIYTGDFVYMSAPSGLTQQFMQQPLSHPLYTTTGAQGWECDGSSASGIYTQAYAICCTGQ